MDGGGFGKNRAFTNLDKTGARLKDVFEKAITPAQIIEEQDFARECVRKNYTGC
jgi:hypothetical protein